MIDRLEIQNFKSHKEAVLELKSLNIIAGKNGMGKSSILQALLLLRQSFSTHKRVEGLLLNGDFVIIGNSQDAFCESGEGNEISFGITLNGEQYKWFFDHSVDKNFLPVSKGENKQPALDGYKNASLFSNDFQYIAAEHIASKEAHERNTYYVEQLNQISEKRGDGKYTVHYLSVNSTKEIAFNRLAHSKTKSLKLKDQVDAWLKEISPDIKTVVREDSNQNTLFIRYAFETKIGQTKEYKPENVGFGVSYILPFLVAILSAKKGSLVLIENPESHLHPGGQAALGKLLCLAGECGIQLIVETHSDHIINAVLVNAKAYIKNPLEGVNRENVSIYFVDRHAESHTSKVTLVPLNEFGIISKPPPDFFDQMDKDLEAILKRDNEGISG